ncbi:MAG: hypothetical protein KAH20_01160 [Methylococcales bacterium]|nr:hypothetical protein [Methylococcales bacterium]
MKKIILRVFFVLSLIILTACSAVNTQKQNYFVYKTLVASGYSQLSNKAHLSPSQNRYASEQTAKLNSYRALAKQLYSEELTGGMTVADQVIKNESFRTYLDLFLREAKVIDSTVFSNQQKLVLELKLSPRFYACFSTTVDVVNRCLKQDDKMAFTRVGYKQVPVNTVNLDCVSLDCASQLSVSGFSKKKNSFDSAMLDYGLYDREWTINMALKSVFRYFVINRVNF